MIKKLKSKDNEYPYFCILILEKLNNTTPNKKSIINKLNENVKFINIKFGK